MAWTSDEVYIGQGWLHHGATPFCLIVRNLPRLRLRTVCTGCSVGRPYANYVHVGFEQCEAGVVGAVHQPGSGVRFSIKKR